MGQFRSFPMVCAVALWSAAATDAGAQFGACCNPNTGLCTTTGDAVACAALTPLAGAYFGDGTACPTYCEREPNGTKAEATVVSAMAPGDVIAGLSMGSSIGSAGNTAVTSGDEWNITTTAAPSPGIWRYRLILSTTTPSYHNAFIQGRTAINGAAGTSETTTVQTALLSSYTVGGQTLPAHTVQWYANETPSHIYYRVTGNGATTEPYTVTLHRDLAEVGVVPTPVDSGPVFVSTQGLTTTNTDMWLYNYNPSSPTSSNFTPVPGAGNNQGFLGINSDGSINSSNQCRLQRVLPMGATYIAAISAANLANNLPAPSDDDVDYRTGSVILDFDNALCTYSGYTDAFANLTSTWQNRDFRIGNLCSATVSSTITNRASLPFEITFWQFSTNNANLSDTPYFFTASSALQTTNGVSTASTLGGGTILLTVTAAWTGGPGPTVDLSAFGGSAAQPMFDDGTHGDAAAGDKKWSYNLTVPANQTPNIYTVTFTGPTYAGQCVGQTRTVPFSVLPPNNSCANAVPIVIGGSYAGTTLGATGAGGFPTTCNGSPSFNSTHGVWYTFTEGPSPHRLSVNLCDPATDFNANMVLFEALPGGQCASGSNGLTCVSSSTDSPVGCLNQNPARDTGTGSHSDTPAILNWNPGNPTGAADCTVPNTTYFIVVLNVLNDNVGGHFVLHLDDTGETCQGTPPAHAVCSAARPLTTFPTWDVVFRGDAPSGPTIPSCASEAPGSVWYSYTPSEPGNFFHAKIPDQGVAGTATSTVISVYTGAPGCDALTEVPGACLIGPEGYVNAFTTPITHMDAGTKYFALVSNFTSVFGLPSADNLGFNFVPDPGACCTAGACTMTSGSAACTSGGGTFRGYSSTCSPSPCATPTGVCCRGATCNTSVPQASCVGNGIAGGLFASSSGGGCNSAGNTHAPCCYADYNKVNGISVQDIFDFLNDWFAGSHYALVGGNGASGTLVVQNIFDFLNAWFAGGCS